MVVVHFEEVPRRARFEKLGIKLIKADFGDPRPQVLDVGSGNKRSQTSCSTVTLLYRVEIGDFVMTLSGSLSRA